jgi:hypothetical protein
MAKIWCTVRGRSTVMEKGWCSGGHGGVVIAM